MKNAEKYLRSEASCSSFEWVKKDHPDTAPQWCSIDLVNGSRAFTEAMTLFEKEEYFKMLVKAGFKHINAGNPLTSWGITLINSLVQKELIPDDTYIQIMTGTDKKSAAAALRATEKVKNLILSMQTLVLLDRSRSIKKAKEDALEVFSWLSGTDAYNNGSLILEYSIDICRTTDIDDAIELFNTVADFMEPDRTRKIIFCITQAGEFTMPHVFASLCEYVSSRLHYRDGIILGVRPSNDRGTAVSAVELSLLAGVERVEGAIFGFGERAGTVDIVSTAMNLYSSGIDPGLDFSDLRQLRENYQRFTGLKLYKKIPFSGESSFSVYIESHQNEVNEAIRKRAENSDEPWDVPYLIIDPADVGRDFASEVIRKDSLSGNGGINYILNRKFGFQIPAKLKADLSKKMSAYIDNENEEPDPNTIFRRFERHYIDNTPVFTCPTFNFTHEGNIKAEIEIKLSSGNSFTVKSEGTGHIDAVSNAYKKYFDIDFDLDIYEEHSLSAGMNASAVAYVCIKSSDGPHWGVGISDDIIRCSVNALTVAVNHIKKVRSFSVDTDPRVIEMLDFIKDRYDTVTLDDVARRFYLSKQYVSRFIKEKSGLTFCENVQKFRMKKAEELLVTTNLSIETVAERSGYPSVEHFNRKFKKLHGTTPMQYRKTR